MQLEITDNRALQTKCYCPEYTFVEKLQTISTKYRLHQKNCTMPVNFLRHYYDVYKLLENDRVLNFIGSKEYIEHKNKRFRAGDEICIKNNLAFIIPDNRVRSFYAQEFKNKSALYFTEQPDFFEILERINKYNRLL